MTATDGFIAHAPDSTGKNVDTSQLVQSAGAGLTVQRQRFSVGDPAAIDNIAGVSADGGLQFQWSLNKTLQLTPLAISTTTSGLKILVAAVTAKIIRVYRMVLTTDAATSLTFQSDATGLSGPIPLLAGGGVALDLGAEPWFVTVTGQGFKMNTSNSANIGGVIYYTQI